MSEQKDKTIESSRFSMPAIPLKTKQTFAEEDEDIRCSHVTETISERLLRYKEIKLLCDKTKLPPLFFVALLFTIIFMVMIGYFEDHLTLLIGTLYPIYMSIKTLQYGTISDTNKWLCYWLCFAFFNWLETFFWWLLLYIPLYNFLRLVTLLILYLPQFNCSIILYEAVIKKLYINYHEVLLRYAKIIEKKLYEIETKSHLTDNIISSSISNVLSKSLSSAHFTRKAVSLGGKKNNQIKKDSLSPFDPVPKNTKNQKNTQIDISHIEGVEPIYNDDIDICNDTVDSIDLNQIELEQKDIKVSAEEDKSLKTRTEKSNTIANKNYKIKAVLKVPNDKDKSYTRNKSNTIQNNETLKSKAKAYNSSSISTTQSDVKNKK